MKFDSIRLMQCLQNYSPLSREEAHSVAVIDPKGDNERMPPVLREREEILEKFFLTHGHPGHVGAAAELAARFAVPSEGSHYDDLFWLQVLPSQCQMRANLFFAA